MGTRCRITVILSEEDRKPGLVLRFDPDKIEHEYAYTKKNGNLAKLKDVKFDEFVVPEGAEAVRMYCQFDGYPTGVGKTLVRDYNTYDKALNLVLGGPAECVDRYIKPDGTWGGGYLNCKVMDPFSTRPKSKFVKEDAPSGEAYEYKFKDGEWYVRNDGYYYYCLKRMLEEHPALSTAIDVDKLEKYHSWMPVEEYIEKISEPNVDDNMLAKIIYARNPEARVDELKKTFDNIPL